VQPEELIGLWVSTPFDFGTSESTSLALLADGSGWTSVAAEKPLHVRTLSWDCPKPGVLEVRYRLAIDLVAGRQDPDFEFVRAQYTLRPEESTLHLSQHIDSPRRFALSRREISAADDPAAGPVT